MKSRIPWSVSVNILTGACTIVETYGASVGVFSTTAVESAPVAGITCKINICKKVSSPYHISRQWSVDLYLYCLLLQQLASSTRLQVDQTCPMGYIPAHILIQRVFKDINQSYTSVMDAIGERFEGLAPSYGGTQRWAILSSYLLLRFSFWYRGPPSMAPSSLVINF